MVRKEMNGMENKRSIFRQESLDRVESPEKLDKFIKASRPSAWVAVIALLVLAIAVIVWGFTGRIPKVYVTKGVSFADGNIYCYIVPDDISAITQGCQVNITLPDNDMIGGTVAEVSTVPYSGKEISDLLKKDWLAYQFVQDDYGVYMYQVRIETKETVPVDYIVSASIITDNVKPLVFLFN